MLAGVPNAHQHGKDGFPPMNSEAAARLCVFLCVMFHVGCTDSLHGTSTEAVLAAAPHRPPAYEHTTSPPALATPLMAMQFNTPMAAAMPSGAPLSRFLLPTGIFREAGAAPSVATTVSNSTRGFELYSDSTMDGGRLLMAALSVAAAANKSNNSAVLGTKCSAAEDRVDLPYGRGVPPSAVVAGVGCISAYGRLCRQIEGKW